MCGYANAGYANAGYANAGYANAGCASSITSANRKGRLREPVPASSLSGLDAPSPDGSSNQQPGYGSPRL